MNSTTQLYCESKRKVSNERLLLAGSLAHQQHVVHLLKQFWVLPPGVPHQDAGDQLIPPQADKAPVPQPSIPFVAVADTVLKHDGGAGNRIAQYFVDRTDDGHVS